MNFEDAFLTLGEFWKSSSWSNSMGGQLYALISDDETAHLLGIRQNATPIPPIIASRGGKPVPIIHRRTAIYHIVYKSKSSSSY